MISTQKTFMSRSLFWIGALLTAFSLILSACSPAVQETAEEPLGKPENQEPGAVDSHVNTPTAQELRSTLRPTELLPVKPSDPVTPGDLSPPVTGEVPASLLEAIRDDLAQRSGLTQEAILVIRDQAVTWSDGSLGCPKPGEFYTQALVQGYWVVMQAGEKQYDYRASQSGYFFLCEGSSLPFSRPSIQE